MSASQLLFTVLSISLFEPLIYAATIDRRTPRTGRGGRSGFSGGSSGSSNSSTHDTDTDDTTRTIDTEAVGIPSNTEGGASYTDIYGLEPDFNSPSQGSSGAIIAIAMGVIAVLIIMGLVVWAIKRNDSKTKYNKNRAAPPPPTIAASKKETFYEAPPPPYAGPSQAEATSSAAPHPVDYTGGEQGASTWQDRQTSPLLREQTDSRDLEAGKVSKA